MSEPDLLAVVINVKVDMDASPEHRRSILEEYVFPEYAELPGFLLASWMNDGQRTGLCLVEFDSKQHARGALDTLTVTAHGRPEVIECGVYAIEFEASA
jgi:hypothetical protein